MIIDSLDAAMGFQQLHGGFGPHSGDPGDIVCSITRQPQHVNDLGGGEVELCLDGCPVNGFILHGIVDDAVIGDQLHKIFISGDHDSGEAIFFGQAGTGAYKIICFKSLFLHNGNTKGGDHLLDIRNLRDHLFWHGGAVSFILIVHFMAESGTFNIKKHGDVFRAFLFDQF